MAMKKHGKIGVLIGGPSSEREISLKSGKAVFEALKNLGLDVEAVDIITDDIKENIRLLKSKKIDCAFIALHGKFGEDGGIQRVLEEIRIPYTGSGELASRLAMDKIASRKIFFEAGLSVPRYKTLKKESRHNFKNEFRLPVVIKPATNGSSIGLSIVSKEDGLESAFSLAFSYDNDIIIEEFVEGRELTVGILEDKALPVIEIVPKNKFFDFEAKYHSGLTDYIVPAKLDKKTAKKVQEAAQAAHKLLDCFGCSRVDIILDRKDTPVVLEVNTIPGFTSTSLLPKAAKTVGIEFSDLCLKLLDLAYEKK